MKNCLFILMATIALASCGQRPMTTTSQNPNKPVYYDYNPEDTVDNEPYWQLLRIDSARAEYRMDHPINQLSSINLGDSEVEEKSPEQRLRDDSLVLSEAETKWIELIQLCSQKQYEKLLSMYIKEETEIGIALATSTNKFELDYFVIGPLLFDQLEEEEASELLVKFLEYDKFLAESVILLGESQQGYVPPHYAALINLLGRMYTATGQKDKAEEQIELFRKAMYMLYDDEWGNEFRIADFKVNIYSSFGDQEKMREAIIEHRNFVVQYGKDNDQDYSEQIGQMDALIEKLGAQ